MVKKSFLSNKKSQLFERDWNPDRVFFILCGFVIILSIILLFNIFSRPNGDFGYSCNNACNNTANIDYFEIAKELYEDNSDLKKNEVSLQNLIADKDIKLKYYETRDNATRSLTASDITRVGLDDIQVYDNRVVFYVNKAFPVTITPSRSMYPFINNNAVALQMKIKSPNEITIGDIIGFQSEVFNTSIIHRVIDISEDTQGWYAVTKGDTNQVADTERVRFSQVEGVLVGLVY